MKKRKKKNSRLSRQENLKLIRERIALRMLMQSMDETKAQNDLIRTIQQTNIQSR